MDSLLEQSTSLAARRAGEAGQPGASAAALALQRAGIRVHVIPVSEIAGLEKRAEDATGMGGLGSTWVSPGLRWHEAARETGSSVTRPVASDGAILKVPPGAIRILARAWVRPSPGSSGISSTMLVQVVPQLMDRDSSRPTISVKATEDPRDLTEATEARVTEEVDRGQVLSRMRLEVDLLPTEALVISYDGPDDEPEPAAGETKPEKPEVGEVRRTAPPTPPTGDSAANPYAVGGIAEPGTSGARAAAGPVAPAAGAGPIFRTPTLGEVLLTRPAPGSAVADSPSARKLWRRLVILVPRMDGRFGLFPGS